MEGTGEGRKEEKGQREGAKRKERRQESALANLHHLQQICLIMMQQNAAYKQNLRNGRQPPVLEMWANAQRDGRPAEYRWCPLFNAAKFGWRPLLECRAVTLPGRETRWNLLECPKLTKWSQPLVGRSSPYCEDMWRRYCWLTAFSDCRYVPYLRRYSPTNLCDGAQMTIFGDFLRPVFSAIRVQHVSDHSKFALRPRHV